MEKCNKCGFSLNHHSYSVFKTENGDKIYLNTDGILTENETHVEWDEIIDYLKEIRKIKDDK